MLAAGQGYRCHTGDRLHLEVETLDDAPRFGGCGRVGKAAE